jgi:hypothetical protein
MAVKVGVEVAEEGATVLAPRARRCHQPVDALDGVDGVARGSRAGGRRHRIEEPASPSPPPSPSPPLTPEPKPIDGFEFDVTLNYGADLDSIRITRKFGKVVNIKMNQVVLRVRGTATGLWTVELLFHRTGTPLMGS